MRDTDLAIEVRALDKRYTRGMVALEGVDLAIARGTITAIIGANGSGKSTLLKILAGVLRADSGTVRVLGQDPALSHDLHARIGYIAQSVELDPEMTGIETLQLFAALHGLARDEIPSRIEEATAGLELGEHLDRLVGTYSGGLRQRLHIAIGFMHRPQLLLMDEPTAALDQGGRAEVWRLLQCFSERSCTVVLITHDTAEASRYCDTVVLLHRGRVVAIDSPEQLVANHARWTLSLRLARRVENAASIASIDIEGTKVEEALLRGDRVIVYFMAPDYGAATRVKNAVVTHLEAEGETIVGFTLDPPALSSAYFKLTGAVISRSEPTVERRKPGSKGANRAAGNGASV